MKTNELLTESLEDYLEAIFEIIDEQQAVKPKNIADRLKVSQPSVTSALKVLADKNLIHYVPYGVITLTAEGKKIAQSVSSRHAILRHFFVEVLNIDKTEANEIACKMEHIISDHVLDRLTSFSAYVTDHQKNCASWSFKKRPLNKKK